MMAYKNNIALAISSLSVVFLLSACEKSPYNYGNKVNAKGVAIQKIGNHWAEGEKLIKKGNKLIQSGEKDIAKGESLITNGKSKIEQGETDVAQGKRLKTEAVDSYNVKIAQPITHEGM